MTGGGWLARLDPPVPESFRAWLALPDSTRGDGEVGLPDAGLLERAAREALARARSRGDGARDGAYDLLAADAFVTWSAEAALDDPDPGGRLRALVRRIAGAASP